VQQNGEAWSRMQPDHAGTTSEAESGVGRPGRHGANLFDELPLASVLVNNHNYGRYLGAAIDSALGQDYPRIEVVVVDDGSTDDSREVIAGYGHRVIAVLKANGGQGSAFNAGAAASRGEILCFLDADDVFYRSKVSRIVQIFRAGGLAKPAMVHHNLAVIDADGERFDAAPIGRSHASPLNLCDFAERYRFIWNEAGPTSGLSINRALAERLFPIPEDGVRISADDFVIGGASLLGELHFLPDVLTDYRVHGANNWYGANAPKSGEFLQRFQAYLNAKLVEMGRRPVISFMDSIYAWDILLEQRRWGELLRHMLTLTLRHHDKYTIRFVHYTFVKAVRALRASWRIGEARGATDRTVSRISA
jgi:glycosyltransferase involved in cell wall biosynthesis